MANKYLDGAGLDHMWDKIKSYLTSNYAAKSHTHTIAQITNLQTTLNGKANSSHTHTSSQITDLSKNYVRPVSSLSTSAPLPSINIGEMKGFSFTLTPYVSFKLPSGGTYMILFVSSHSGGLSATFVNDMKILSGGSTVYSLEQGQFAVDGFYIRIS